MGWTEEEDKAAAKATSGSATDEQPLIRELLSAAVTERRRARRWGIFFKSLFLAYLFVVLAVVMGWGSGLLGEPAVERFTAVVRVSGSIGAGGDTTAEQTIQSLQAAFQHPGTRGVILHVNSPGGSPVHASQINDAIVQLKAEHPDIPLHAVADDMMTSAAYYLAVSADRIHVNPATLIGSIGVVYNGFGLDGLLERLAIDRRLYTAGSHKAMLDPFSPEQEDDVAIMRGLLAQIHEQFIDAVRAGRGERLVADEALFSGRVWTGQQAVELGLADSFGRLDQVAESAFDAPLLREFSPTEPWLDEWLGDRLPGVLHRLEILLDLGTRPLR